jgi:hypothetical protein
MRRNLIAGLETPMTLSISVEIVLVAGDEVRLASI